MMYIFRYGNSNRYKAVFGLDIQSARAKAGYERGLHCLGRIPVEEFHLDFEQGYSAILPKLQLLRSAA